MKLYLYYLFIFKLLLGASYRTYRYFFLKKSLKIEKMSDAASRLLGEHDFRNLAKLDVVNVSNFVRVIYEAKVLPFSKYLGESYSEESSVYMLEIKGSAFLWHM